MANVLEKLESILNIVDDGLTREEFVQSFEAVLKLIVEAEEKHQQAMNALLDELTRKVNKKLTEVKDGKDSEVPGPQGPIGPRGEPGKDGKDGKDGKSGINGKNGKDGKDGSPDTPEQVRDKLESLNGDDRLDKSAIKGLDDELEKLVGQIKSKKGGRGMRKVPIVRTVDLTADVDGSTTEFTLPMDTVKVLGVWGTQFPVSFRENVDWKFSGRTLTLQTSEVDIPQSGQTLFALIETLFYA